MRRFAWLKIGASARPLPSLTRKPADRRADEREVNRRRWAWYLGLAYLGPVTPSLVNNWRLK